MSSFFKQCTFLIIFLSSCQTTVKKIDFAIKGYEISLSFEQKKRIIDQLARLGYYFPKQAVLASYISEAEKPEKITLESFNGTDARTNSTFHLHRQTQVFISSEMKKTILLCQEKYYLSAVDQDFNNLMIFGAFASNQQIIKKLTEIIFYSDIFFTEKNPSLDESLSKCRKENSVQIYTKALDFYKAFSENIIYPAKRQRCSASNECQNWFAGFHSKITSQTKSFCMDGFCELRSRPETASVGFYDLENKQHYIKLDLKDSGWIVQNKDMRFICHEKDNHYYLAEAFNYEKPDVPKLLCLIKP